MFKTNVQTPMDIIHFGIGSVIKGHDNDDDWIVVKISDQEPNVVGLLNLYHMYVLSSSRTIVNDINFFTEQEARNLMDCLHHAFSDYDLDPKGLKFYSLK